MISLQLKRIAIVLTIYAMHCNAEEKSVVELARLTASNAGYSDEFGRSVAIYGDTAIIGAPNESSNATGINGDQGNNNAVLAGAAYIFIKSGTNWVQQAYLKASNTDANDSFGYSVAIYDDTAVVGARYESSSATGINGDQTNNNASRAGAAYIFVRNGTNWTQQAYLKASNSGASDYFGHHVALSGDTAVVSAIGEDSIATGVNGIEGNNQAVESGAAYVFVRSGTNWTQQAYVKASNTETGDSFGSAIAIDNSSLVVGARLEDGNASTINGDDSNNDALFAGAAYVFTRSGAIWTQQAYLKASNSEAEDLFGSSVAIDDDRILVGAFGESSNASAVNGDQSDNSLDNAGAAYLFKRNGTVWSQEAYLKASNPDSSDSFGTAVAIQGGSAVVGADREDGTIDNPLSNSESSSGAIYLFSHVGTNWNQTAYIKSSNSIRLDRFGSAVALHSGKIIAGAYAKLSSSGTAYIFSEPPPPPVIVQDPSSQNITLFNEASFFAAATSTTTVAYQWRKNGNDLQNDGHYSGVTTDNLRINQVNRFDGGLYALVASNEGGDTESAAAMLTIMEPVLPEYRIDFGDAATNPTGNWNRVGSAEFTESNTSPYWSLMEWNSGYTSPTGPRLRSLVASPIALNYAATWNGGIQKDWVDAVAMNDALKISSGHTLAILGLRTDRTYRLEVASADDASDYSVFFQLNDNADADPAVNRFPDATYNATPEGTAANNNGFKTQTTGWNAANWVIWKKIVPGTHGQESYGLGSDAVSFRVTGPVNALRIIENPETDSDSDGLPDDWELNYFGASGTIATNDFDGDGISNLDEYISGFDPTNGASFFMVTTNGFSPSGYVVNWISVEGRQYGVYWTDSLTNGFTSLETNIFYPQNSYTDTVHTAEDGGFYHIDVQRKP